MIRPIELVANLPYEGSLGHMRQVIAQDRELGHACSACWRFRSSIFEVGGDPFISRGDEHGDEEALYDLPEASLASFGHVSHGSGSLRAHGVAATPVGARRALEALRTRFPQSEPDPNRVAVQFWSYGPQGPAAAHRELDAPSWEEISDNYEASGASRLRHLMTPDFRPGQGGQLILWHGEPGTGKTTALRALAREWAGWADIHYITDPEKFFGNHADYMIEVMVRPELDHSAPYATAVAPDKERWRLLVLEDTGELLQADARREAGQALSRFLNAVDGLIGQGLRVLVLVTTNEEWSALHPAVARAGRCAAEVEFLPLSADESDEWLDAHGLERAHSTTTLADLYAQLKGYEGAAIKQPIGFS